MNDRKSRGVGDVFELLNRWRHLPFYSLETRAAPFFALFMWDVLSKRDYRPYLTTGRRTAASLAPFHGD